MVGVAYSCCSLSHPVPWPPVILTSDSCPDHTTHTNRAERNVTSTACRYPLAMTLFGLKQVQCSMAEAAPQDWPDCFQLSKKKELALWKVSKQKNESDKKCNKGRIAFLLQPVLRELQRAVCQQTRCSSRHDLHQLLMQNFRFLSVIISTVNTGCGLAGLVTRCVDKSYQFSVVSECFLKAVRNNR